ncbi:MAG: hypothetical protein LLG00_12035, partial [Planctomycetaceae bacterium]|nr:hypothetical protein [Planctomycetaceae bacterium]
MGFLSGSVTMDSFRIDGEQPRQFGTEHIKTLERFSIDQAQTLSPDQPDVGFIAGGHLFDIDFDQEKNVIGETLHCGVRIDTNQIPAAVRKAWLQIELAALTADNPSGRPTKVQRQEAKEAVEARCQDEAKNGSYRRMQQFPVLWDASQTILFFGGSSATAAEACCDLYARAFELELARLTAGRRAQEWAAENKRRKALDEVTPASFRLGYDHADIAWWNNESGNFDFLGNEFLLWLWWRWETQSDTIALPDDSEVTGMFARTLSLQCPLDESGKETISAESPVRLPEAAQAIRTGKLPRKAGLTLVRQGEQYELTLQAETFTISGARIRTEDTEDSADGQGFLEQRLESVRGLHETVDLLFRAFCERRVGKDWTADLDHIRHWLKKD